jgi:hypothetical protein
VWEPAVPRIKDEFFNCVIYLYPSRKHAEDGASFGGCGFMVGIPIPEFADRMAVYLVTNRHVIEDGSTVVRLNKLNGATDVIDLTEQHWILDPSGDDLAICPLAPDLTTFAVGWISIDQFITKQIVEDHDFGPGDDAFVIGRFVNHEGRQKNAPSARFGNIAQMPLEPIRGKRASGYFDQESFLVEARSIPGYSGSPVFGYIPQGGLYKREKAKVDINPFQTYGAWLLGVDWCHINDHVPAYDQFGNQLAFKVRANSGMMGVIPAWRLAAFLNIEPLRNLRMYQSEQLKRPYGQGVLSVSLDSAKDGKVSPAVVPPANDANPNHREDFTRLLGAAVKKPE